MVDLLLLKVKLKLGGSRGQGGRSQSDSHTLKWLPGIAFYRIWWLLILAALPPTPTPPHQTPKGKDHQFNVEIPPWFDLKQRPDSCSRFI